MRLRGYSKPWLKPSSTDLTIHAKSPIFSCRRSNSRLLPFYGSKKSRWVSWLTNPIAKDLSLQIRQSHSSMLGYRPGLEMRDTSTKESYEQGGKYTLGKGLVKPRGPSDRDIQRNGRRDPKDG